MNEASHRTRRRVEQSGACSGTPSVLIAVEPRQIDSYLAPSQRERRIPVLARDSKLFGLSVTPQQAVRFARQGMVSGMANKHGYLRHLVAEVSLHRIRRAVFEMSRPALGAGVISHLRQEAGARQWVMRPDAAKAGLMGSRRSVFL